jgi:glucose-fructose oxidoreductase
MRKKTTKAQPRATTTRRRRGGTAPVRWGVIGLGHFAQSSILPAFAGARKEASLEALFSGDARKRALLGKRYQVPIVRGYDDLDEVLQSKQIDAVYVAVPNHLHREFTLRAARAGVHVLCEKPLAVTVDECAEMIRACSEAQVKLMVAYRLHFAKAYLAAIAELRAGRIGEPRYLSTAFSFILDEGNVRGLPSARGGGPMHDIGVYCINAARTLLGDEPDEVVAFSSRRSDATAIADTEEQLAATLRFPGDCLASFTVSFSAADRDSLTIVGTKGSLSLEPAYTHRGALTMTVETTRGARPRQFAKTFDKTDQVAAELAYFSNCIRNDQQPEPSGREGLNDVAVIDAVLESARTRRPVHLDLRGRKLRPQARQAMARRPGQKGQPLVRVAPPRG